MATANNHNRTRSRWGMCLNDSCEKSKNHERIEIVGRKDFVCPECGKPLKECPPPVSKPWAKYIAIAAGVLVLCGGGAYFALSSGNKEAEEPEETVATDTTPTTDPDPVDTADVDTAKQAQQAEPQQPAQPEEKAAEDSKTNQPTEKATTPKAKEPKTTKSTGSTAKPVDRPYGTVRVAYGSYTGDLRNGKPHGHGTVRFSTTYTINSSIVAHAGDSYEGEFRDGRISGGPGYWSHDGDKKYVNP